MKKRAHSEEGSPKWRREPTVKKRARTEKENPSKEESPSEEGSPKWRREPTVKKRARTEKENPSEEESLSEEESHEEIHETHEELRTNLKWKGRRRDKGRTKKIFHAVSKLPEAIYK